MIDLGHPTRGKAFIRRIQTAESYAGSPIVIPEQVRDKVASQQFVVEAVGGYERCEDEECERPHIQWAGVNLHKHKLKRGDWVLVRKRSWELTPDPHIYVCRVDAILGRFIET